MIFTVKSIPLILKASFFCQVNVVKLFLINNKYKNVEWIPDSQTRLPLQIKGEQYQRTQQVTNSKEPDKITMASKSSTMMRL